MAKFYLEGHSSLCASDKRFKLESLATLGDSSLSAKIRRDSYTDAINRGPSINSIMTKEEWEHSFEIDGQKHIGKRLWSTIMNGK